LRVSKLGEKDDERVIEVREESNEQVIQAQLRSIKETTSQPSSQGSSSSAAQSSLMPGIVACTNCNSKFAEGVKFCGKCGNRSFTLVSKGEEEESFPCPRCSAKLPALSKFCGRCGLRMNELPQAQPVVQPKLPPQADAPESNVKPAATPGLKPILKDSIHKTVEKICLRCGSSFPPHIKFCGRCGTTLA
jgi:ribosomal protein L40E